MTRNNNYSRRKFLTAAAAASVAGSSVILSGCEENTGIDRKLRFRSLNEALLEARRLADATELRSEAIWSLPQTLVHCAQSIEFSVTGFPQMKSTIFQNTLGSAAFRVFSWRGRMSHDLGEAIPGAPSLNVEADVELAMTRLHESVEYFRATREPLQPHFAYGHLDKPDYEQAHAMHLANHFSVMEA